MTVALVLFINFTIFVFNLILIWQLIKFKAKLVELNTKLLQINQNITLGLKQISLEILLAGLEIRKIKNKYHTFNDTYYKVSKVIIVTKYVYQIYQGKLI